MWKNLSNNMGLLNNFLNRKQKEEQLSKIGEKQSGSVAPAKEKTAKKPRVHKHEEADKTEAKASSKASDYSLAFKVLLKPLVTEKSAIAESHNKYSFIVARSANKNQIKKTFTEIYNIKPTNVNIVNVEGRQVRFGRSQGRRSDYKKAIITLPQGKTIDIHTGV